MSITSVACSECGTIKGKKSCCGRGGSWFGNCGGTDNTKLKFKWSQGVEACLARSRTNKVISTWQQIPDSEKDSHHSHANAHWAQSNVFNMFKSKLPDISEKILDKKSASTTTERQIRSPLFVATNTSTRMAVNVLMSTSDLVGAVRTKSISEAGTEMISSIYVRMSKPPVSLRATTVLRVFVDMCLWTVLQMAMQFHRTH